MNRKQQLSLYGAILFILIGVSFYFSMNDRQAATQTVRIGMAYIPNVQFAPWYIALKQGFFREEGLEVEFDYRMDVDALQLVATGQLDFAIAGGDQVITARAQNIPVVYLMSLYAKFPPAVIALASSTIKTPQDLIGKRVGLPLYGTNLLAIKAILNRANVPAARVQLIDIGYTQIPSLTEGKVDAIVGFVNNEPIKLAAAGYAVNQINAWNYLDLVGHGLITGETQRSRSPELIAKMVRASVKGMRYALEHPQEALEICFSQLPELGPDQRKIEADVFKASLDLWENDFTKQHGLGTSNIQAWKDSVQLMLEMGLIKQPVAVEEFVDSSFLK